MFVAAALFVAAQSVCAQAPPDATTVPFDLRTMRPVLEVFINGDGPFKFVLDTGASSTMVSWDLAERLKLPRNGVAMVGAPNSAALSRVPMHRIKELRVGDLKFFGVSAAAIMDKDFTKALNADGIVSAQDFRGYLVTLDYRQRQLVIEPGRLPVADGKQVFDSPLRANVPGIELEVMGEKTYFHLDTGSPFHIALPGRMVTETAKFSRQPTMGGTAATIAGQFLVYYAQLAGDITIGKYKEEKPAVQIMDKMPYGNLGYRFFRDYKVTFDYNAMRVKLVHWQDAPTPPPH
ncbi:MAG: retropepsin-like aspartic protease [Fimbriimonadaceae bacterium]